MNTTNTQQERNTNKTPKPPFIHRISVYLITHRRNAALLGIGLWATATMLLLSYFANASRLPAAINMGSAMQDHETGIVHDHSPTPVTSLVLADTTAPLKSYTLTAQVISREGQSEQWAFNGTVPGPGLRVQVGDHVQVTLVNQLPVATTIHWHGINVPNAADGVAGVTQDAVPPGQSYTYDFIATEPGTYWYHSHQDTSNQIPRGLLGALVVEPTAPPHYDHDFTLVYHDAMPPGRDLFAVVQKITGNIDQGAIAVNGTSSELRLDAEPGQQIRLRLINASAGEHTAFGDPLRIVLLGAPYQVVALDGHDLNQPQLLNAEVLPIGAGQRYDLVFRMPGTGVVQLVGVDQRATVTVGEGAVEAPDLEALPTFDIAAYGSPLPGGLTLQSRFDVTKELILGNRPGFHNGEFGLNHTINDHEFPDVPMLMIEPGQTVKLHFVNETDEYHPMHVHGHTFTVLAKDGIPLSGSPVYLDSILLAPGESWDVAFTANNPGLWMLHCHVLIHAATGMDMMVVYPDISTPYVVGSESGNIPE